MPRCPICGHDAPTRPNNTFFPFCSMRCKQVDLGQWLDERYRVPVSEEPQADPDPPQEKP
jgi:endogenous inhibitor of DNA gyrase (YacG/DUF329 family)